jgi:hypothetical protein
VICWQYFSTGKAHDEEFLASGSCGFCIFAFSVDIAQIVMRIAGKDLRAFDGDSRTVDLGVGCIILWISVKGMRVFRMRRVELRTREAIMIRYGQLSPTRKNVIMVIALMNCVSAFVVHQLIAR